MLNNKSFKNYEQKIHRIKGIDKSAITIRDFNTPFSVTDIEVDKRNPSADRFKQYYQPSCPNHLAQTHGTLHLATAENVSEKIATPTKTLF